MPRKRRVAACVALLTAHFVVLHGVQALVGHGAFAFAGPGIAIGVAAVFWRFALRGDVHPASGVKIACVLVVLLVLPEWLEGELAAGRQISVSALGGHELFPLVAILAALVVIAALEARRTIGLLRDAFD